MPGATTARALATADGAGLSRGAGARPAIAPSSTFRPEVHGLRALAVALVVAYHLYPAAVPGGYVGVDIFFVLSGFLITGIMLRELERTGQLSLTAFYVRRARRILPAATVTIVGIVIAGLLFLPATRWSDVGTHAIRSAGFVENWLLASESVDYLAEGRAPSPFQHFWSLSVEEQFYLLWPGALAGLAALALARRWRLRTAATAAVSAIFLASLASSLIVTASGSPAAYFVTHTRVWELAAGALLACLIGRRPGPAASAVLAYVGLGLIGWAAFRFSGSTAFPGFAAAVPIVGACAVIVGGTSGHRLAPDPLFRSVPVTWLGNVSYSLYLWHWPVIVIVQARLPARIPGWVGLLVALLASLGLAAASRRWVEEPFLTGRWSRLRRSRAGVAAVLAIALGLSAGLGAYLALKVERGPEQEAAAALLADPPPGFGAASITATTYAPFAAGTQPGVMVPSPQDARAELPVGAHGRCKSPKDVPTTPTCSFGPSSAPVTIALVGDSHIEQYLPAFQLLAGEQNWRVVTFFHASCPFSTAQRTMDRELGGPCLEANAATVAALADLQPDLVITSSRTAVSFIAEPGLADPVTGFVEAWEQINGLGIPVAVIADNPLMLPADATNDCVAEHRAEPQRCERSRTEALPQDFQLEAAAIAAATEPLDVTLIDLTDRFCTATVCPPVIGNVLVYRDEQHVTPAYARTLTPFLLEALEATGTF